MAKKRYQGQQARQLRSNGNNAYCMTTGSGTYAFATAEEADAAAEAYCDRVEASYRARGIMYFDRRFNKMSYELTKEELAFYEQKTSSTKSVEQVVSCKIKDHLFQINPGIPKESKKAMVVSSKDEEEWHDEDTHGSFNPADPKCKCAIS